MVDKISVFLMAHRILLAGLFHETHTFIDGHTGLADFTLTEGENLLAKKGDGSPIAGFLEVAETSNWEVVPAVDLRTLPSACVEDAVVDFFWDKFSAVATREIGGGLDAVFLIMHGAMVSASEPDVEGEVLARLRQMQGFASLPVFVVLDLHANVTSRMAKHANALVAYQKNPHTDAHETALRAAKMLQRSLLSEVSPHTYWRRAPIIWAPPGTGTGQAPVKSLMELARMKERDDSRVWEISVTPGFSFADTLETGVSFSMVATTSEEEAQAVLRDFCREAWNRREEGVVAYPNVDEVLTSILPVKEGPIVLIEPSDNIGGGAPGDGTGVLRSLLNHQVPNSAVIINDPYSVSEAVSAGLGAKISLRIGGRGSSLDAGPVELDVEVISLSEGHFDLEDMHSHLASNRGRHIEMGPCAVVRYAGITILLTSKKTPPFDLGQWRSQGIDPESFSVIAVKAAVAHRQVYDPISTKSYFVDTAGPCSSNVFSFDYKQLLRPVWPLDSGLECPDGRV